jgi:hypothetical protein
MKRVLIAAVLGCAACASAFRSPGQQRAADLDAVFWRAVAHADPANPRGSLDSAIVLLDSYLAAGNPPHAAEARTIRQLARDSQQLGKVQASLQVARDVAAENKQRADVAETKAETKATRSDDAVKEVERLKDELAKAREELERIKKRLATPPTKP